MIAEWSGSLRGDTADVCELPHKEVVAVDARTAQAAVTSVAAVSEAPAMRCATPERSPVPRFQLLGQPACLLSHPPRSLDEGSAEAGSQSLQVDARGGWLGRVMLCHSLQADSLVARAPVERGVEEAAVVVACGKRQAHRLMLRKIHR